LRRGGQVGEIGLEVSLRVEEAGQIGVVETPASRDGNDRFRAKGDTEAGGAEHRQIVGAVANRDRFGGRDAELGRERQQCLPLGLPGDDRRQHPAGQPVFGNFQSVGDDPVKAECGANAIGKDRESSGNKCGHGAVAAHRCDEALGAGHQCYPGGGLSERTCFDPRQQGNPSGQSASEINLAVHRLPSDFGDVPADAKYPSQLVEHFVFDDRRFEVGDEQPLAPAGDRLNQRVDCRLGNDGAQRPSDRLGLRGVDKKIAGFFSRQPHRLGADRERVSNIRGVAGEAGVAAGGDQGDDKAHRLSSYDAKGMTDKQEGAPPVIVIAGPTASGKSMLAMTLAEQMRGTVINADALQCYRDLEILTAAPVAAARARAPHRLYGYLDAAERGSADSWRMLALAEIAAATSAGRLPIVIGGTGLYLRALQHGLAPFPEIPEAIREETAALHRALGGAKFRDRLAELDPASARRLPPGDTQRLMRAYAVVRASGTPIGAWRDKAHPVSPYCFATILMMPPRDRLYAACDARLAEMVGRGALAEAKALAARRLDPDLPAMKAVGLPELLRHLRGEMTLGEAITAAQMATRRYAKRQMTWFRHQSHPDLALAEQFSESLLRRSRQFIDEFLLTVRG
jgi:tRNA dimethylallyltransferase